MAEDSLHNKYCMNRNGYGPGGYCNTILVDVPFFNSVDHICPRCNPEKLPDPRKTERKIKEKFGFVEKPVVKKQDANEQETKEIDWEELAKEIKKDLDLH